MRSRELNRFALNVCVASALLAGCGGSQASIGAPGAMPQSAIMGAQPPCGDSWILPEATRAQRLIYVANNGSVLIFPERPHNPRPIGRIVTPVDSNHGLYVDHSGNLYVTNGNNTVTVYRPGSATPSTTYSSGLNGPMFPIVDGKGNVFISNGNGTVVKFLRGDPKRYVTLKTPGYEADGIALDDSDDLYVAYRTTLYAGSIEEFPRGSSRGEILGMQIVQPQGLIVTSDRTILLVQTGPADGIYVFPPGSQKSTLKLSISSQIPVQLAITESEHKLFVSTFGEWRANGRIYETPYPLGPQSQFHIKVDFRLRCQGHRRRKPFGIQGMALTNEQYF
jgi:hypothetical protein